MKFIYTPKNPDKAYLTNNLLLPKSKINCTPIKAALTFLLGKEEAELDPDTGEALRMVPRTFELWEETANHLIVPREFLTQEQFEQFDFEFVDLRPTLFDPVEIEDRIVLRDKDQQKALDDLLSNYSGTLNLSCGKGKTVLGLKLAATLKVPTLIIVNTTALLEQWREEIELHLGVSKIGQIQGDINEWHDCPIVLAMVHTLSLRKTEWDMPFRRRFGLVLYDEGHHMSAPVFVNSADLFFGRRYSLTATPNRTDGLEMIYQFHLGRVIHSNLSQDLIPVTYFHILHWSASHQEQEAVLDVHGEVNVNKVRTFLGGLEWRNDLVAKDIRADLKTGRKILVLSHSVEHVNSLFEKFKRKGAGLITGQTLQEDRMSILRECNPVFGTFQLAREGLNKPSLDTLYVVTPFNNSNDVQQAWGRIQRRYQNKQSPLVRIYEDQAFPCCIRSCRGLRKHLRKLTYPIYKRELNVEFTHE